jgi:hypothetical protein
VDAGIINAYEPDQINESEVEDSLRETYVPVG